MGPHSSRLQCFKGLELDRVMVRLSLPCLLKPVSVISHLGKDRSEWKHAKTLPLSSTPFLSYSLTYINSRWPNIQPGHLNLMQFLAFMFCVPWGSVVTKGLLGPQSVSDRGVGPHGWSLVIRNLSLGEDWGLHSLMTSCVLIWLREVARAEPNWAVAGTVLRSPPKLGAGKTVLSSKPTLTETSY